MWCESRRNSHDNYPVDVAATTAVQQDRVQDGPQCFSHRFPVEFHQRSVRRRRSVSAGRASPCRCSSLLGGDSLDSQNRCSLEIFTRPIPVSLYLLASASGLDPGRPHRQRLGTTAQTHGPQAVAQLVAGNG